MPKSDYIFEKGEPIEVGREGDHEFVFASGESVTDRGESELVFESGVGLGGGGSVDVWVFVDTTGSSGIYSTQQSRGKELVDALAAEYGADGVRAGSGAIGPGVPVQINQSLTEDLEQAKNAISSMSTGGGTEEYNNAATVAANSGANDSGRDVIAAVFADSETGDTSRSISNIIADLRGSTGNGAAVLCGQDQNLNAELSNLGNQYEWGDIVNYNRSVEYAIDILEDKRAAGE